MSERYGLLVDIGMYREGEILRRVGHTKWTTDNGDILLTSIIPYLEDLLVSNKHDLIFKKLGDDKELKRCECNLSVSLQMCIYCGTFYSSDKIPICKNQDRVKESKNVFEEPVYCGECTQLIPKDLLDNIIKVEQVEREESKKTLIEDSTRPWSNNPEDDYYYLLEELNQIKDIINSKLNK